MKIALITLGVLCLLALIIIIISKNKKTKVISGTLLGVVLLITSA